jgi:hypothetical protein
MGRFSEWRDRQKMKELQEKDKRNSYNEMYQAELKKAREKALKNEVRKTVKERARAEAKAYIHKDNSFGGKVRGFQAGVRNFQAGMVGVGNPYLLGTPQKSTKKIKNMLEW